MAQHSAQVTHDRVNHPPHYTSSAARCECGKGIEAIQVTETLNFNIGNAVKYLWRCDLKLDAIEDLKKAAWYIQREIARRERVSVYPGAIAPDSSAALDRVIRQANQRNDRTRG